MTLSYWWMHWFWITLLWIFAVSDLTVVKSHSNSHNGSIHLNDSSNLQFPTTQSDGVARQNSLAQVSPSSSSNITTVQKSLLEKSLKSSTKNDFVYKNDTKTDTAKMHFNNKGAIVTNQTNVDNNTINNQKLFNVSFISINNTESLNYSGNGTNFSQSIVSSQEIEGIPREDDSSNNLSAAGITGITLSCVVLVGAICGISIFMYRSRELNRPQVLNDRCSNPDSSGYIDDASVRDNSEEMYSLDNDSFLNSLEAMTIQNFWTDTVKHTKL